MSSIPSNAMPHATAHDAPPAGDAPAASNDTATKPNAASDAIAAATARLPKVDVESARKRLSETGEGLVAQIKAHPAGAAAAGALLVGGIALSAIPSLRRRSSEGLERVKSAAQARFGSDPEPAKKGKGKGRKTSAA